MSQNRRRFTPEVKAQIVRRHLSGKEPVSKLAASGKGDKSNKRRSLIVIGPA